MISPDARRADWAERLAAPYLGSTGGAAVFVVADDVVSYHGFGAIDAGRAERPGPRTIYEIGSITKVFTAVLLARLAAEGKIDPDEPIASLCSDFNGLANWITPRALATHSSGLPRVHIPWWRLAFIDATDPYRDFGAKELIDYIRAWRPHRPPRPGTMVYSNLAVGLLGFTLARGFGTTYEALLRREVLDPLGLTDTRQHLSIEQRARLANPHRANGSPTPPWTMDALAGAGGLKSTATDLASFARAAMASPSGGTGIPDALRQAFAATLEPQVQAKANVVQCLGWMRLALSLQSAEDDCHAFYHDGGTIGSSAVVYVVPASRVAIGALSNTGHSLRLELRLWRSKPADLISEIVRELRVGR